MTKTGDSVKVIPYVRYTYLATPKPAPNKGLARFLELLPASIEPPKDSFTSAEFATARKICLRYAREILANQVLQGSVTFVVIKGRRYYTVKEPDNVNRSQKKSGK